jgi:hypothetical protein
MQIAEHFWHDMEEKLRNEEMWAGAGEHAGHDCKEFVGLGFYGIGAG